MCFHASLLKDFIPLAHLVLTCYVDLIMVVYSSMIRMYMAEIDLFIGTIALDAVVC